MGHSYEEISQESTPKLRAMLTEYDIKRTLAQQRREMQDYYEYDMEYRMIFDELSSRQSFIGNAPGTAAF
jgi:hypothetical protein